MTKVINMSAAIKLNECRGEASSGKPPSQVLAANSNRGGGGMDNILSRLGTVESAVFEVREQVIGIVATIPSLATKSDVDAVRIEVSELRGELRGIAATIPHLATKADLSAEIGSVRTELGTEIGSVRTELGTEIGSVRTELRTEIGSVRAAINALETSIIKWLVATVITAMSLGIAIEKFVH
jgi:hypothetical protein